MGIRILMEIMINHINTFNHPSERRSNVDAKEVLLIFEDRMEKNPEHRLRMPNVSKFSLGISQKCSPKPRETLVDVQMALTKSVTLYEVSDSREGCEGR